MTDSPVRCWVMIRCADQLINKWSESGYCMLAGSLQAFAVMFALTWFFVSCTDMWIRVVLPANYFNDRTSPHAELLLCAG